MFRSGCSSVSASNTWSKLFLAASKQTASTEASGLGRVGLGQEGIGTRCRGPGSVEHSHLRGCWLTGLPWGHTLSQFSLVLRPLHFITLIPLFQHSNLHSGKGSAAAASGLLGCFQCHVANRPQSCLDAMQNHGAPLISGAQPSSQKAEVPLHVWPHLLRWCGIHIVID